jgi:DNA replication protein DnaC
MDEKPTINMDPLLKPIVSAGVSLTVFFFKKKMNQLERDLTAYTLLRKIYKVKLEDDFNAIYIAALYNLIHEQGKDKRLVALFNIKEVKEAFEKELYNKNNISFPLSIDSNLHTSPEVRNLKGFNIDIDKEIKDFKAEFRRLINRTRKPKEVEAYDGIETVDRRTSELLKSTKGIEDGMNALSEKFDLKFKLDMTGDLSLSTRGVSFLVENVSKRKKVVKNFYDKLTTKGCLFMHGSASTGKTQLAFLISEKFSGERHWVNLRGIEAEQFFFTIVYELLISLNIKPTANSFNQLEGAIERLSKEDLIVIDGLPKLESRDGVNAHFIGFLKKCLEKEVKVLITSSYHLPEKVKEVYKKAEVDIVKVPFFNEEEVKDVLLSYGVENNLADSLKGLILSVSAGHPTIINAICRYLYQKSWEVNDEEITTLFRGDYSIELTEETNDELLRTVNDQATRELLYRLSLIIGSFSLNEVRIISEVQPTIVFPVEKFNSVVGLWVQRANSNKYELSPLVKRLKSFNLTRVVERNVCHNLGKEILLKGSLNQFDALGAINYLIRAEEYNHAGFVLVKALHEFQNKSEVLYDFTWYSGFNGAERKKDKLFKVFGISKTFSHSFNGLYF